MICNLFIPSLHDTLLRPCPLPIRCAPLKRMKTEKFGSAPTLFLLIHRVRVTQSTNSNIEMGTCSAMPIAHISSTVCIESGHCSYFRNFSGRYGITLSLYSWVVIYFFFLLSSFCSLFGRHSPKWNIIRYPYRNEKKVFDVRPIVDRHLNIF